MTRKKIKKNKKGFTLLELLVVMAILAILITGATGTYRTYINQVHYNKARATLSYVVSQAEAFKANTGFFLPNLEEMNVSFLGLLQYAYFINCLKGDGSPALGDSGETCGSFTDIDPPDSNTDCSDCSSATPTQWMGTVLAYSYCQIDQTECESSFGIDALYCDINVRNSLQISNLCKEESEDDDNSFDFNEQQTKRNSKFMIKGSSGMCYQGSRFVEEKELRALRNQTPPLQNTGCAHSKEYVPVIGDPLIVKPDRSPLVPADTAYFSRPNYLRVFALGCKEREDDCKNSHERTVIYLDTNGNMGDYLIRPPSTP